MTVIRVVSLCVAAAMISSTIRAQRPEMATVVSLAAGLAALGMMAVGLSEVTGWVQGARGLMTADGDVVAAVLKAAGIAIVSELGVQLCEDAGEGALAGRIALSARLAVIGLCLPMLGEMAGRLEGILP